MNQQTRRAFISKALMAGAGATVVAPFGIAGSATAADAVIGPDEDPGFVAGRIVDTGSGGAVAVIDAANRLHRLQLHSATGAWKNGQYNRDALQEGDCLYARGQRDEAGVLAVDSLWANIASIRAEVRGVGRGHLSIASRSHGVRDVAILNRTIVADHDGREGSGGDVSGFSAGDSILMIASADPRSGALTASRVISLMVGPSEDSLGTSPPAGGPITKAFTADRTGVTSWFCCGNVSGCGAGCGSSGAGACTSWPCASNLNAMAWPKLTTGCGPFFGDCSLSSDFPTHACGSCLDVQNPCIGTVVTVRIRDCGPTVHCVSPKCNGYDHVAYDLTPCAFTALGKPLSDGLQGIQVTTTHAC